jgi:hypothetical protein
MIVSCQSHHGIPLLLALWHPLSNPGTPPSNSANSSRSEIRWNLTMKKFFVHANYFNNMEGAIFRVASSQILLSGIGI